MARRPNHRFFIVCGLILCAAVGYSAFNFYRAGHSYWVSAAAFSPDGSLLATAAGDEQRSEIILWDIEKLQRVARKTLDSGRPTWVTFSGEGRQVALACDVVGESSGTYRPSEITFVDLDRGAVVESFSEPDVAGGTIVLDKTRKLATYGRRSIDLRGLDDGQPTVLLANGEGHIHGLGISPDERHLAAAGDGVARVWELPTGAELPGLDAEGNDLDDIAVANGGNFVAATRYELYAAGAESFPLFFWDRTQGPTPVNVIQFAQPVTTLRYLSGEPPRLLVASGKDHLACQVAIYAPSGQLLDELYVGKAAAHALDVTDDGRSLVWVDSRGNGELWSLLEPKPVRRWQRTLGAVRSIRFSPDQKLLAGYGWSQEVELIDASTGQTVMTFEGARPSQLTPYLFGLLPLMLLFVAIHWFSKRAAKHREAGMLAVARQLGWQHSSGALPDGIPPFQFFAKRRGGRFEHVPLGAGDDYDTLLAIYRWTEGSGDKRTTVQELCVIYPHLRSDLPELFIRPESLTDKLADYVGFSDVDLNSSQILQRFSDRYLLRTKVPERMPALINDSLAEFLCDHEGWNVEIQDGSVLLWWQRVKSFTTSRFPVSSPEGIQDFLAESQEIVGLLVPDSRR